MRVSTELGGRPAYTDKENALIIRMRDDFPSAALLLGRTENAVEGQYNNLVVLSKEEYWLRSLLEIAPLNYSAAQRLYAEIKREFPGVAAAQGRQNGKHFVSVAYTSRDEEVKIDKALYSYDEWVALRPRIVEVYERKESAA